MDVVDGNWDELVENVSTTLQFISGDDGTWMVCVRGQNEDGFWGECDCLEIDVDTIPPDYPEDVIIDPYICNQNRTINATVCDSQTPINGGIFYLDEVDIDNIYPMSVSDGVADELCEDINGTLDVTDVDDGCHEIMIRGIDIAGNWGKIYYSGEWAFILDTTAPNTSKYLDGDTIECNYDDDGEGNVLDAGCYYTTAGTVIVLDALDNLGVQNESCRAESLTTYYRMRWKLTENESWPAWPENFTMFDDNIVLTEDSMHEIEFYSVDSCGNEETHHFELDIVDTKAPLVNKTVSGPQINGTGDIHKFLNGDSEIKLECIDQEPHPVGGEILHWQMYWSYNDTSSWTLVDSDTEESGEVLFTDLNNSYHKFVYWCEDALGNVGVNNTEIDAVDNMPPELDKTVGEPKINCSDVDQDNCQVDFFQVDVAFIENGIVPDEDCWYVNQSTEITLDCVDPGPHEVDNVAISWYWTWSDDGESLHTSDVFTHNGTSVTFNYTEDSRHTLYYSCTDALGNTVSHIEHDVVDSEGPEVFKEVGYPHYGCGEGEDCYVTTATPLTVTAVDPYPHPVGEYEVYCEWNWTNNSGVFFHVPFLVNGSFSYTEDSNHSLHCWAIDRLGNRGPDFYEDDIVDTQAPDLWKEIGEPKVVKEVCDYTGNSVDASGTYQLSSTDPCLLATQPGQCAWLDTGSALPPFVEDTLISEGVNPSLDCGNILVLSSGNPLESSTELNSGMGNPGCGLNPDNYSTNDCVILNDFTPEADGIVLAVSSEWPEYVGSSFTDWMQIFSSTESVDISIDDWGTANLITYGPSDSGTKTLALVSQGQTVSLRVADSGDSVLDTALIVVPLACFDEAPETLLCGNGDVDPGEECDDGNTDNGDGCNSLCMIEGNSECHEETFVTQGTELTLFCEDTEPHPVDNVTIHWYWDWDDGVDTGESQEFSQNGPNTTFTFTEDSWHTLHYWCEDALGNNISKEEDDIVDTQAPLINKTISGPQFDGTGQIHKFLNGDSEIKLECIDQEPHPVGGEILHWEMYWSYNDTNSWTLVDSDTEESGEVLFTELNNSYHKFVYWCEDELGNVGQNHTEIDAVDTQPPVSSKEVGMLNVPILADEAYNMSFTDPGFWVTDETEITLDCIDEGPHPIGGEEIYFRVLLDGEIQFNWTLYNGLFSLENDSNHTLEWFCVDELNNAEQTRTELDIVDTAPPNITKFVEVDGDLYFTGEEMTYVSVQPEEVMNMCAYVEDFKKTGDPGVGVDYVKGMIAKKWTCTKGDDDPFEASCIPGVIMFDMVDQGDGLYCAEIDAPSECGNFHYFVGSSDRLGNWNYTDGIEIIVDGVPPVGIVLNPHAGRDYYGGMKFKFYAPAVDFGGTSEDDCCQEDGWFCGPCDSISCFGGKDEDCEATGVDYCDLYAVDYPFENLDQSEIYECTDDLLKYIVQVGIIEEEDLPWACTHDGWWWNNDNKCRRELLELLSEVPEDGTPYVEYIGRVPYVDGACEGYQRIMNDTQLTDTVFLAWKVVDNAGNGADKLKLALNPSGPEDLLFNQPYCGMELDGSLITMNIQEKGDLWVYDWGLLGEVPVTSNDLLKVKAYINDSEVLDYKECIGIIKDDEGETVISYVGKIDEVTDTDYTCLITGSLPDYSEIESGYYTYVVEYKANNQVLGSDWMDFVVDNDRPTMGVIKPVVGLVVGEMMPVSLHIEDSMSSIADETVLVRVSEPGSIGNIWCMMGCEETGWLPLSDFGSDMYTGTINLSAYNLSDGDLNFDAVACDVLYQPDNDPDNPIGLDINLDRNTMHCKMISNHGANAEERPECNDGVDNDYDEYIDFGNDPGCENAADDDETDSVCGDGIIDFDEQCEEDTDCSSGEVCDGCVCVIDCTSDWQCSACDGEFCEEVTDNNSCGETFTGNLDDYDDWCID